MSLSLTQRITIYLLAIASFTGAIALLFWAGLPQRSDYTGFVADGIGYVAPEIGEIAPPINANLLSGNHIHLSDYRGQSLIINFWATWCAPCAIEMPELQTLHQETDIPVLAINIAESPELIQQWVDDFDLTFDIVLDPEQTIYRDYRLVGQPTTYILNPDGIITHIFYGPTTADALQAAIDTHQT